MTLVICTKQKIYWQQSWHSLYSLLALSSGVLSLTKSTVLASQTPSIDLSPLMPNSTKQQRSTTKKHVDQLMRDHGMITVNVKIKKMPLILRFFLGNQHIMAGVVRDLKTKLRTTSTLRLVGVFSSFLFLDNSIVIIEWEIFES